MPFGSEQWMYSSGGFYPYEIDQSLRFNDDDSAYLSRTPASTGNRKTWTFSCWYKRTTVTTDHLLRVNSDNTLVRFDGVYFRVFSSSGLDLKTTQMFRDPSAWYHICVAVDTTQATASDRVKIYINGQQVSDFLTETYPSLNFQTGINDTADHFIGTHTIEVVDGYMAEVNLIDGQALDATDFGEFKSGVWIPKSYSGTYGTNGFYLDFGNSGSLGADSSGNGNNWTPANLAATDQVLDSPTNNFATMNSTLNTTMVLSEGNLKSTNPANGWVSTAATISISNGKWYWETVNTGSAPHYHVVGVVADTFYNFLTWGGSTSDSFTYYSLYHRQILT